VKKWYDPLECDNTVKNPFIADSEDLKGVDELDLVRGQLIENWDETAWFKSSKPKLCGNPDDVLQNALGLPIYSARLRKTLDKAGVTGIQYLPVGVFRSNNSLIKGFAIANILSLLPAMDFDKSDYDLYEEDYFLLERRGKVRGIRKPVLRSIVIEGYDVFRLKEFNRYIIVSERFRNIFIANGFTGYSFHQVYTS